MTAKLCSDVTLHQEMGSIEGATKSATWGVGARLACIAVAAALGKIYTPDTPRYYDGFQHDHLLLCLILGWLDLLRKLLSDNF